ncbi:MAG: pilus assembly protein [Planctomycetes bacterium]|nr:pilus assembly protein [Planctomycetota bacterium]
MAIITPLLLTLVFGIIEYGWVFSVKQALVHSAREGARTAVLPGSSEADILERVQSYLQPLGLTTYSVELTRATAQEPTEIVHVTIPYADVTLVGGYFGSTDFNLGSTCSMRKEGLD